jgi:hypothetical protein
VLISEQVKKRTRAAFPVEGPRRILADTSGRERYREIRHEGTDFEVSPQRPLGADIFAEQSEEESVYEELSEEESEDIVPQRAMASSEDIRKVVTLPDELQRAVEREKLEQVSGREAAPEVDYEGDSERIFTTTKNTNAMSTPTLVEVQPFRGNAGESLESFFRRFDWPVRWSAYPQYPAGEEGVLLKEMDTVMMMQHNLTGRAFANRRRSFVSVTAFKGALEQAFPRSGMAVPKGDQRKVKALRYYETLSVIDPRTGKWDPPELYVRRAKWFKQHLPETLHLHLTHLFLTGLHDSQLMYAIKMCFSAGELTFDNVVERYERCNTTEGCSPNMRARRGGHADMG